MSSWVSTWRPEPQATCSFFPHSYLGSLPPPWSWNAQSCSVLLSLSGTHSRPVLTSRPRRECYSPGLLFPPFPRAKPQGGGGRVHIWMARELE